MYQGGTVQTKSTTDPEPQIGIVVKADPLLGVANFFTVNRVGGGTSFQKSVPFDQLIAIPGIKYASFLSFPLLFFLLCINLGAGLIHHDLFLH